MLTKKQIRISKYNKRHYYENIEYHKERSRLWRINNPEKKTLQDKNAYKRVKDDPEWIANNRLKARKWAINNPERYKERQDEWKQDLAKVIYHRIRSRAKARNYEFNLEKEDIIVPTHCPVLGMELNNKSGDNDNWPAVDRVDNNKGYIKGNIQIISYRANRIKSDANAEELRAIADYMDKYLKDVA